MKLNNVQVCLDCEELYIGDYCPKCCSRDFFYLRKYFEPFQRFGGHYEPVTVRQHIPIQKEVQSLQDTPIDYSGSSTPDPHFRGFVTHDTQTAHSEAISVSNSKETGNGPKPRKVDHLSRKLMESVCTLLKGGYWANASASPNVEGKMDKERVAGPGKEPVRWDYDPEEYVKHFNKP